MAKLSNTKIKNLVRQLAEQFRYEVQDELDLGSTWDKRLNKIETEFTALAIEWLDYNGLTLVEDCN